MSWDCFSLSSKRSTWVCWSMSSLDSSRDSCSFKVANMYSSWSLSLGRFWCGCCAEVRILFERLISTVSVAKRTMIPTKITVSTFQNLLLLLLLFDNDPDEGSMTTMVRLCCCYCCCCCCFLVGCCFLVVCCSFVAAVCLFVVSLLLSFLFFLDLLLVAGSQEVVFPFFMLVDIMLGKKRGVYNISPIKKSRDVHWGRGKLSLQYLQIHTPLNKTRSFTRWLPTYGAYRVIRTVRTIQTKTQLPFTATANYELQKLYYCTVVAMRQKANGNNERMGRLCFVPPTYISFSVGTF